MTGIDIILFLIGVLIWGTIGATAAWGRFTLFGFCSTTGFWYGLFWLLFEFSGWAVIYAIVYLIVVVGCVWRYFVDGLD